MSINKFYESARLSTVGEPLENNSIVNRYYVDSLVKSVQSFVQPQGKNLDMQSKRLRNLVDPERATDAVTKQYVDSKERLIVLHFKSETDPDGYPSIESKCYKLEINNTIKYKFLFAGKGKFSWISPQNCKVISGGEEIRKKSSFTIKKGDEISFIPLIQTLTTPGNLKAAPLSVELIVELA